MGHTVMTIQRVIEDQALPKKTVRFARTNLIYNMIASQRNLAIGGLILQLKIMNLSTDVPVFSECLRKKTLTKDNGKFNMTGQICQVFSVHP